MQREQTKARTHDPGRAKLAGATSLYGAAQNVAPPTNRLSFPSCIHAGHTHTAAAHHQAQASGPSAACTAPASSIMGLHRNVRKVPNLMTRDWGREASRTEAGWGEE